VGAIRDNWSGPKDDPYRMKTLAMDLSTGRGSMAWFDKDRPSQGHQLEWPNDRKNSGLFFENLQTVVERFGLPQKIVVGLGPGSYAGIRIAISAAIGLQAAGRTELIGYPSVCAMPLEEAEYTVVGDARRSSFFFVRIRDRAVFGKFELLSKAELEKRINESIRVPIASSDSPSQFPARVELAYPSAEILAQLASDTGRHFVGPPLEPIYLRGANVTVPKQPIMRGPIG